MKSGVNAPLCASSEITWVVPFCVTALATSWTTRSDGTSNSQISVTVSDVWPGWTGWNSPPNFGLHGPPSSVTNRAIAVLACELPSAVAETVAVKWVVPPSEKKVQTGPSLNGPGHGNGAAVATPETASRIAKSTDLTAFSLRGGNARPYTPSGCYPAQCSQARKSSKLTA